MNEIEISDLLQKINTMEDIKIIDIRDKYQYNMGHIEKAICIPINYLLVNAKNYLVKDETYYIYCDTGRKSAMLCDELNYLGYNTINVKGGFNNYLLR